MVAGGRSADDEQAVVVVGDLEQALRHPAGLC